MKQVGLPKRFVLLSFMVLTVCCMASCDDKQASPARVIPLQVPDTLELVMHRPSHVHVSSNMQWICGLYLAADQQSLVVLADLVDENVRYQVLPKGAYLGPIYDDKYMPVFQYSGNINSVFIWELSALERREIDIPPGDRYFPVPGVPLILIYQEQHRHGDIAFYNYQSAQLHEFPQTTHGFHKICHVLTNGEYVYFTGFTTEQKLSPIATRVFCLTTQEKMFEDVGCPLDSDQALHRARPRILGDHLFAYFSSLDIWKVADIKSKRILYTLGKNVEKEYYGEQVDAEGYGSWFIYDTRIEIQDTYQSVFGDNYINDTGKLVWIEHDWEDYYVNVCDVLTGENRLRKKFNAHRYSRSDLYCDIVQADQEWYFSNWRTQRDIFRLAMHRVESLQASTVQSVSVRPYGDSSGRHEEWPFFWRDHLFVMCSDKIQIFHLSELIVE